jgi:hypothetical protein
MVRLVRRQTPLAPAMDDERTRFGGGELLIKISVLKF